ncbi:MAG: hypothetical protein L0H93_21370 [Nocardioides sp.]|nr:hypothetical protein [Nocardioides sp.]
MYPPPIADSVSSDLAARLDDQFFTGDPSAYFRARLRALLATGASWSPEDKLTAEVQRLLGPGAALLTDVDPRAQQMQVAVDAIALRHQIAEALLRLLHAILHKESSPDASLWVALTDTPNAMKDVIKEAKAALRDGPAEAYEQLGDLLLPRADVSDVLTEADEIEDSRNIHIEWVNFAIKLMLDKDPDLNAAHNKFKHGMAIRPQDDLLLTLMPTGPSPDGTVEADVLNGPQTAALLDGVTAEFLARRGQKHGLELTQMRTDPALAISEAGALMITHALLFHRAAVRHFAERKVPDHRKIATSPGCFVGGPHPGKMRADRPFALRFPLSLPLPPGASPKPQLFWTDGKRQDLTIGKAQRVRVVDTSGG